MYLNTYIHVYEFTNMLLKVHQIRFYEKSHVCDLTAPLKRQ